MLGNLSKILIRTPDFFNNSSLSTIKEYEKSNQRKKFNIFNSNKNIKPRKYRINDIYFRERDFWLKNYEPDINFNHNQRFPFSLKNYPLKRTANRNLNQKNPDIKTSFNSIDAQREKYFLTDRQLKKRDKSTINNIFSIYKINSLNTDNNIKNDLWLKTESNTISNRKNYNLGLNDEGNSKYISININDEKSNEDTNSKNKKSRITFEFPSIYKTLKSQENLFQDRLDRKFNSLKTIRPEIKEQIKTKNRSMVGKKEFLKYLRLNRVNLQNPFYESIKMKEDLNGINFKKK